MNDASIKYAKAYYVCRKMRGAVTMIDCTVRAIDTKMTLETDLDNKLTILTELQKITEMYKEFVSTIFEVCND